MRPAARHNGGPPLASSHVADLRRALAEGERILECLKLSQARAPGKLGWGDCHTRAQTRRERERREDLAEAQRQPERDRWTRKLGRIRAALAIATALAGIVLAEPARADGPAIASWYGPGFHGRTMANGQRFDQRGNTVAHRSLQLGTRVTIANPRNGRRVIAVVRDRGPYIRGRDFDLSKGLAQRLRVGRRGVIPVTFRVIHKPPKPVTFHRRQRPT